MAEQKTKLLKLNNVEFSYMFEEDEGYEKVLKGIDLEIE